VIHQPAQHVTQDLNDLDDYDDADDGDEHDVSLETVVTVVHGKLTEATATKCAGNCGVADKSDRKHGCRVD